MPKRSERLPPSARRVFLLSLLALVGWGAYRLFLGTLLPETAAINVLPLDALAGVAAAACALFFYWMARLRYKAGSLRNRPGRWAPALVAAAGLVAAGVCLQWGRAPAAWTLDTAWPRLAGAGLVLAVAACEEIGFRGPLFLACSEWGQGGLWLALILGSAGFAAVHAAYQSPWNLTFAAMAGLALGVARLRGASLASLVLAHAAMDGVETLWMGTSLTISYWTGLTAAAVALAAVVALVFLPSAPLADVRQP